MKAFIIGEGRTIEPFGSPVGELWVLTGSLRQAQERALDAIGVAAGEIERLPALAELPLPLAEPALALEEGAFVNPAALREFVRSAGEAAQPVALGLAAGPVVDWCCALERGCGQPAGDNGKPARQQIVYLPAGATLTGGEVPEELWDEPPLIVIDPGGSEARFPASRGSGRPELVVPMPARLALPIRHWTHLLLTNLLGFSAGVQEVGPVRLALRLLWAVLRARSLNPYAVAGKLNHRGRGCLIHPSAVVEGSWLGDRVRIGPHAVVQGCVLGDDAVVEELASAVFSVMGPGALLQRFGLLRFSTAFPHAEIAGTAQMSVLGEGAALKHGAIAMDMPLGGSPVQVRAGGGLQPAGLPYLGCCLGHGAIVGSGVWLAPGRELPNGSRIIRPPELTVRSVPAELQPGRPAWVRDGRLIQP